MDFTLDSYTFLLDNLILQNYSFLTYADFLTDPAKKSVVLRHDVDARKLNSLEFARIQQQKGVRGTYYFRMVPQSYDEAVIREIASMGHEIGYHYETMETSKGNVDRAHDEFCRNLENLRKITPIHTICMHGSPRSLYDNKEIWKKYDYRVLGIIGEPYFDTDFTKVGYLTDTGRKWNGSGVSVRDKVSGSFVFDFRSTFDIIKHITSLPDQMMFTFHPQRWTNNPAKWTQELIFQKIKNIVKKHLINKRDKSC